MSRLDSVLGAGMHGVPVAPVEPADTLTMSFGEFDALSEAIEYWMQRALRAEGDLADAREEAAELWRTIDGWRPAHLRDDSSRSLDRVVDDMCDWLASRYDKLISRVLELARELDDARVEADRLGDDLAASEQRVADLADLLPASEELRHDWEVAVSVAAPGRQLTWHYVSNGGHCLPDFDWAEVWMADGNRGEPVRCVLVSSSYPIGYVTAVAAAREFVRLEFGEVLS